MPSPLNYNTPQPLSTNTGRVLTLRILAGLLAIGASVWAVLCGFLILAWGLVPLLILGPGYLVTLGYFWRAFGNPPPLACRAIWALSFLVQGTWLAWITSMSLQPGPIGGGPMGPFIVLWWIASTTISLLAFFLEPGRPALPAPIPPRYPTPNTIIPPPQSKP